MIDFDLLVNISEYARLHATKSYEKYLARNQNNVSYDRIYHDILDGKIAEFNAYYYLLNNNKYPDIPDLEVSNSHGFDTDIYVKESDTHLHIKSYSPNKHIGIKPSVTFQIHDPAYHSPKSNHFIVPMIKENFTTYKVWGFIPTIMAQFKELKYPKANKKAVYLEDHLEYKLRKL